MLTLVLGGARSAKSRYARSLIGLRQAIYVATARRGNDRERAGRIDRHRVDRPDSWITIEEPEAVPFVVRTAVPTELPVIVECVTLWLSNLFERAGYAHGRRARSGGGFEDPRSHRIEMKSGEELCRRHLSVVVSGTYKGGPIKFWRKKRPQ